MMRDVVLILAVGLVPIAFQCGVVLVGLNRDWSNEVIGLLMLAAEIFGFLLIMYLLTQNRVQ